MPAASANEGGTVLIADQPTVPLLICLSKDPCPVGALASSLSVSYESDGAGSCGTATIRAQPIGFHQFGWTRVAHACLQLVRHGVGPASVSLVGDGLNLQGSFLGVLRPDSPTCNAGDPGAKGFAGEVELRGAVPGPGGYWNDVFLTGSLIGATACGA